MKVVSKEMVPWVIAAAIAYNPALTEKASLELREKEIKEKRGK